MNSEHTSAVLSDPAENVLKYLILNIFNLCIVLTRAKGEARGGIF